MMPALRGRVSKLIFLNISYSVRHLYPVVPLLMRSHSFSSIDGGRPPSELLGGTSNRPFARGTTQSAGSAINDGIGDADGGDVNYRHRGRQDPPDPIPNRPLRGENPISQPERLSQRKFDLGGKNFDDDHHSRASGFGLEKSTAVNATRVGGNRTSRQSGGNLFHFGNDEGEQKKMKSFAGEKHGDFLEKFKLGFDKAEKPEPHSNAANPQLHKEGEEIKGDKAVPRPQSPPPPPQEADEIFKKMKETGLIPNAVAMLDGLCKDGLVQEAMKLFGLMREKGTIPEVVIYTAVVEGFCKAQKLEDAKRIFRKMQNNGISPNAFSYAVLIQGLYKGRKLADALEFCVEMLESGHSPNLATFAGLVDGFCREKGLEEARTIIVKLREKGYFFDEKAAREYLDKKGPFLPLVWEAILGKKSSQRSF